MSKKISVSIAVAFVRSLQTHVVSTHAVFLGHHRQHVHASRGIAVFVVVPTDHFEEAIGELHRRLRVEDGTARITEEIARNDLTELFKRRPKRAEAYRDRVLCIALCQGAANHFLDGKTGINDFDVYTFYRQNPQKPWYAKRIKNYDEAQARLERAAWNVRACLDSN